MMVARPTIETRLRLDLVQSIQPELVFRAKQDAKGQQNDGAAGEGRHSGNGEINYDLIADSAGGIYPS